MKKIWIFVMIFLLCGCSKKISCNLNGEYNTKLIISYDKEVKSIGSVLTFKSSEEAENYCTLLKLGDEMLDFECGEKVINIPDYSTYVQLNSKIIEDVILELTNQGYRCK